MLSGLLKLNKLSKNTLKNIGIVLGISNGVIFYYTYKTLKENRPEFKHVEPPPEGHRIAIFDNMASTYDTIFNRPFEAYGVNKAKKLLIKHAKGHVLDVASGTLNNLPYYGKIDSLTAIDKSPNMCREMKKKIEKEKPGFPVVVLCDDVTNLPFKDCSFNTVVSTHAFCSVQDPYALVSEIERVMKPSAKLLSIERGKIYYYPIRKLMEVLKVYPNPVIPWKNGYFEDRDPLEIIKTKLDVTKHGIFGYGINYSIFARKIKTEFTDFSQEPQILPRARVFYTYFPDKDNM